MQKVFVTIVKELDDTWASNEELAKMSDGEIEELIKEDVVAFLDNSTILIERAEAIPCRKIE
jgi:hypothetical protein